MSRLTITLFILSVIISSCNDLDAPTFVQKIEVAHQKAEFLSHKVIGFDIDLSFGGKQRLNGRITTTTGSGKAVIALENGEKIYQVGQEVFSTPGKETNKVRFDAFTWSYFFLFPYKLSDKGTAWNDYPQQSLGEQKYLTEKLTFESATGDAPNDWYIIYAHPDLHYIEAAAYVVTANKSLQEAEKDPHAIKYEAYQVIDGVPIATKWSFWEWRSDKGLTRQLGVATLSNIVFENPNKSFFFPPLDFVKYE